MSTFEYNDLFIKCQDTGRYHMFVFDMVGSKTMPADYRNHAQILMIQLAVSIYSTLQNMEQQLEKKILVFEEDFVHFGEDRSYQGFGFKQEPIVFGDTFGFTIYRDSIDSDTVYHIYEEEKDKLGIDFEFHTADGFYETNDYGLGSTQYFRGYCFDVLSNFHKKETIKTLEKIRKTSIKE